MAERCPKQLSRFQGMLTYSIVYRANHYYPLYRIYAVQLFCQILVHDPYSFPLVIGRGMSVGIGQEAFVSVNAQSRMRLVANNRTLSYESIFFTCTIRKII